MHGRPLELHLENFGQEIAVQNSLFDVVPRFCMRTQGKELRSLSETARLPFYTSFTAPSQCHEAYMHGAVRAIANPHRLI